MQEKEREFYSEGIRLAGAFYLPDEGVDETHPLVIPCSGFTGLRRIHPERFARSLTERGYACFAFDYRGFEPSDGEPGRVLLDEQVRDIRHAAWFADTEPDIAHEGVVLLGWGMAGGLVLEAAREIPGVRGVAAVNGFYHGRRVQAAVRSDEEWTQFRKWLREERALLARTPEPRWTDPFWIYPLDPASREYVDEVLRAVPGYEGDQVQSAMADSLLDFAPEERLERLADVPLLVAHGELNRLHPTEEAESLMAKYPGPKELFWLEGAGHTEFMDDDDPRYRRLAARVADWLDALP